MINNVKFEVYLNNEQIEACKQAKEEGYRYAETATRVSITIGGKVESDEARHTVIILVNLDTMSVEDMCIFNDYADLYRHIAIFGIPFTSIKNVIV